MFRRRVPRSPLQLLREFVWPSAGWARSGRYLAQRLSRMADSPHRLAVGLACGAAVSFLPTVGLHFLLAALLALVLRGNVLASAVGTFVGNPWTFPLMWAGAHELGAWILGADAAAHLPLRTVAADLWRMIATFDFSGIGAEVWPIWWPMLIGSLPLALAAWVAAYVLAATFIGRRRLRRSAV